MSRDYLRGEIQIEKEILRINKQRGMFFDQKSLLKLTQKMQRISPTRWIMFSFVLIILLGTLILSLPVSSAQGKYTGFSNALFTATSAVCVTGLSVLDTGMYWSTFGKLVLLFLIQIGGLGFLTLTTLALILSGNRIDLKTRILMKESLGQNKLQGILKFTKSIALLTFGIEAAGALVLSFVFIPQYGFVKGVFFSIFHSVSAYCNAGFDLNGNFNSFTSYISHPVVNLALMTLILLGGIGFTVPFDVIKNRRFHRLSLNSKIILVTNAILLFGGWFLFFVFEHGNPLTIGGYDTFTKLIASVFQSVTCRTAGFNTMDLEAMSNSSKLLSIFLMFIGGSPASTAGGVKVTTVAILFLISRSVVQNKREIEVFHKRISFKSVNKAIAISVIMSCIAFFGLMVLSTAEKGAPFMSVCFEVISAIATVGLTLNLTTSLSLLSKLVLICIMFIGRVGILTILLAFSEAKTKRYKYPEEKIII